MEGASNLGRPLDEGSKYKANMEAAGFVDIVETVYKWPTVRVMHPSERHHVFTNVLIEPMAKRQEDEGDWDVGRELLAR